MESNNNDTEFPEYQPEELALQLNVKDFACRSQAKAKPQSRELAGYSVKSIPPNTENSMWYGYDENDNIDMSNETKRETNYSINNKWNNNTRNKHITWACT